MRSSKVMCGVVNILLFGVAAATANAQSLPVFPVLVDGVNYDLTYGNGSDAGESGQPWTGNDDLAREFALAIYNGDPYGAFGEGLRAHYPADQQLNFWIDYFNAWALGYYELSPNLGYWNGLNEEYNGDYGLPGEGVFVESAPEPSTFALAALAAAILLARRRGADVSRL
ncbi:MAG TPA: PEP-CTERM sorting domain-containing protein [Tepidisphaeraceae bacterium]|nr:PEP-CTERM sorting domain-containing protein [Tepidisphaeraceae bacterium]